MLVKGSGVVQLIPCGCQPPLMHTPPPMLANGSDPEQVDPLVEPPLELLTTVPGSQPPFTQ